MGPSVAQQRHRKGGQATWQEHGMKSQGDEVVSMVELRQQLRPACSGAGLLTPGPRTYATLLSAPLLLWAAATLCGVFHFNGLPERKGDVQHVLLWFDKHIFRTFLCPLLPFLCLLLRWIAVDWLPAAGAAPAEPRELTKQPLLLDEQQQKQQKERQQEAGQVGEQQEQAQEQQQLLLGSGAADRTVTAAAAAAAVSVSTAGTGGYTAVAAAAAVAVEPPAAAKGTSSASQGSDALCQASPPPTATLARLCAISYTLVTLARMVMYVLHLELQQQDWRPPAPPTALDAAPGGITGSEVGAAGMGPAAPSGGGSTKAAAIAYISDHLLLAASVMACLQMELLCCVSDLLKSKHRSCSGSAGSAQGEGRRHVHRKWAARLQGMLLCAVALGSALLMVLICGDMYFTTRFFHLPWESLSAFVLGLLTFQLPLMLLAVSRAQAQTPAPGRA